MYKYIHTDIWITILRIFIALTVGGRMTGRLCEHVGVFVCCVCCAVLCCAVLRYDALCCAVQSWSVYMALHTLCSYTCNPVAFKWTRSCDVQSMHFCAVILFAWILQLCVFACESVLLCNKLHFSGVFLAFLPSKSSQ